MKNKVFSLLIFGIFALAIFASFASATAPTINVNPNTIIFNNQFQNLTFTVHNSDSSSVNVSFNNQLTILDGKGHNAIISFNPTSLTIPATSDSLPVTAWVTSIDSNFVLGSYFSGNLVITDTSVPANNVNLTVKLLATPMQYADNGKLSISDISSDISVTKGYGSDTDWYPFDSVKIKADINNYDGSNKISGINVKYGLYDATRGIWIISSHSAGGSFSLKSNDIKTVTIDFQLDQLSKFNNVQNGDSVVLYVWATGNDNGVQTSSYVSEPINMQFDSDFIILDNVQFVQSPIACGSQAEVTADVINIGSDDQSNVAVKVYNANLGINQKVTIGDINTMEKGKLDFTFNIPSDANEGDYSITLLPIDSNGNQYESSNNDVSQATGTLTVSSSCIFNPKLTVTASSTTATAGQEVDVTASITNTASTTRTFLLTATNYDSWATLTSVTPATLILSPAQTQQVLVKLNANADASGDQTFNIQLTGDGKIIPQPITVTVQKAPGFFSFLTGNATSALKGNWYLWAIGGLNVLLLVIIVVVAVRVSRKK